MALNFLNNGYFAGKVGIGVVSPTEILQVFEGGLTAYKSYTNTNAGAILTSYQSVFSPFTKTTDLVAGSDGTVPSEIRFLTRTNGTSTIDERMRITSAGNVGIGTDSPTAFLEVKTDNTTIYDSTSDSGQDSGTATILVSNDNVTTNTFSQIAFHNKGSNRGISRIVSIGVASASTDLAFVTENNNTKSEKMRILANGNVGIGTTGPGDKLSIEDSGSVRMSIYSTDTGSQSVPKTFIDLYGENTAAQKRKQASIASAPGHNASNAGELQFFTNDSSQVSRQRMTIREDGTVGIGDASPTVPLDIIGQNGTTVVSSITYNNLVRFRGTDSGGLFFLGKTSDQDQVIQTTNNDADLILGTRTGSVNYDRLHIQGNTGNVGIGTTSPIHKLYVNGDIGQTDGHRIWFRGSSSSSAVGAQSYIYSNGLNLQIKGDDNVQLLGDGGGIIAHFDYTGKVGIGTTSPDFKLDVSGTLGVSDLPFNTDSVSVLVANETLGVELVTNGNFTSATGWNLNSNWSISGGTCNADGTSNNDINQNQNVGVIGQKYLITYVISAYTQGTISARIGNGVTDLNTGTGTFSQAVTATTTDRIRMNLTGSFIGSVSSLSIKQITSASNQIRKRELGNSAFEDTEYWKANGNNIHNTNSANVGIGATSPLGRLQVNEYTVASQGNQGVHGELSVFANSGDESLFLGIKDAAYPDRGWAFNPITSGVNSNLQIKEHGSTSVRMTIESGGNVGIGVTNPTEKLHLQSTTSGCFVRFADNTASGVYVGARADELEVYAGNAERFGIDANGVIRFNAYGTGILQTDTNGVISASLSPLVDGIIFNNGASITNQINTDIDSAAAEMVAQVAIATYTAAFFDFVVKKSTNVRSGTVYACHDGTSVQFTETSTQDLGDTSDVVLSVDISGGNMRLIATVASDDWSVKSLIRAI